MLSPAFKTDAVSEAEMLYWKNFCIDLLGRILEARLAGKIVTAEVMPDFNWPKWSACGVPNGVMVTRVLC